jgi:hemerythrin-like domain-containing protein
MAEIPNKASDMLRETAKNSTSFYNQIADHIDHLEKTIITLEQRLLEIETLAQREQDDLK